MNRVKCTDQVTAWLYVIKIIRHSSEGKCFLTYTGYYARKVALLHNKTKNDIK